MHQIILSEVAGIVHIHTVSQHLPKSHKASTHKCEWNYSCTLEMKIDIGAAVSIEGESTWENNLP